jgi:tripeptidyl-peptidase-1
MSPTTSFTLQTLDGGVNTQTPRSSAGIEAVCSVRFAILVSGLTKARQDLDTQVTTGAQSCRVYPLTLSKYTIGVATGVPVTFISVGERNGDGVDGFMCWVSS